MNGDLFSVDGLLKSVFQPASKETLKDIFNKRVEELKINPTDVLEIVGISYRPLQGILNGTQKTIDFTNLIKLSNFLQIPKEKLIQLYMEALERSFPDKSTISPEVVKFIKENFDLAAFKKAKFISSVSNFQEIERKLLDLYKLKTIFEYQKPKVDVAFSAGLTKPANELTRTEWIKAAETIFEEIDNPYEYDRKALIDYFPQIRWHSTLVEKGLIEVIRDLYKLGVTVIYQAPLQGLHLHGATFQVNGKPCVVLTNYRGFYPTLWFALIHELFHVLFDWQEIMTNGYHLSDDDNEVLTVVEKEKEANEFAREYLFSNEKLSNVKAYINNEQFVKEFATSNHVHRSFIYVFQAFGAKSGNGVPWKRAQHYNPDFSELIQTLQNPWEDRMPTDEYIKYLKNRIYKQ